MATGGVSLAATNVTVQSNGTALVKLTCLGTASCRGKLTLTAKDAIEAKGAKGKKTRSVSVVTTSFSIPGDETKAVEVKLDAPWRALLGVDHGHCSASLELLELAPKPQNTQTKTVHLKQQKPEAARNVKRRVLDISRPGRIYWGDEQASG